MKKYKHITTGCREAYEKGGKQAVYDLVDTRSAVLRNQIHDEHCKGCESVEPAWEHQCLICGQPTTTVETNKLVRQ
jgi:hypothetical protein